jgi:8-amino-7-oxononanoate synthase
MANPQRSPFLQRPFEERLAGELESLAAQSQLRRLELLEGINLFSNDYLGLSTDQRLRDAVTAALAAGSPVGSTGSRLLSGNAAVWQELESELARFCGSEAALYFNSGYAANVGLFSSLPGPDDIVFSDRANHASIIDGIRLSGARKIVFPHRNLDFLEDALRKPAFGTARKFIALESVFSMDGDRAPVSDLLALADRYDAYLIFDEAHATGVFGPQGRGLVAEAVAGANPAARERVVAVVHTCGKALAGVGGFVSCSETLKQYLVNRARTFIFSTALPPYLAAQMLTAIRIAAGADRERRDLAELGNHLRARLHDAGFDTGQSESQIVPVILGDNAHALDFAGKLCREGFVVRAIRPPTVPRGTARLRLSLHVGLTKEILDRLVDALIRIREDAAPAVRTAVTATQSAEPVRSAKTARRSLEK